MLESVVFCSEEKICKEISEVIANIPRVITNFYSDLTKFKLFLSDHSVLFAIVAIGEKESSDRLVRLTGQFPQTYFIYYYPNLNIDNFHYFDYQNFSHLVVGEKRKAHLSEILLGLTKDYWKKIPFERLKISYGKLSPRLKKVMNYIETHDLKNCDTANIANFLNISQGYFSQEFKRETGLTFRSFMQKLLDHYEYIIFDRLDLSAKTASRILGYSELSSFSRSYKKRKGYPPSHQKNHKVIELDRV